MYVTIPHTMYGYTQVHVAVHAHEDLRLPAQTLETPRWSFFDRTRFNQWQVDRLFGKSSLH
jgi:hypothetical protein